MPDIYVPPSADTIVLAIVGIILPSSAVIALVGWVFVIQSYLSVERTAVAGGRLARRWFSVAASMRPISGPLSILITLSVLCGQALTLLLCYLGGNYIAMIWDDARWRLVLRLFSSRDISDIGLQDIESILRWDYISGGYVVGAAFLLTLSYIRTRKQEDLHGIAFLVGLPGAVLLFLLVPIGALYLAAMLLYVLILLWSAASNTGTTAKDWELILTGSLPLIVGIAACGLYYRLVYLQ